MLCRRRASPLLGAAEGGDYTARGSGLRCCSGCSRGALRRALESCVRLLQAAHNTKPLALNFAVTLFSPPCNRSGASQCRLSKLQPDTSGRESENL